MNERGRSGWSFRGPELFGLLLIGVGILYFLSNTGIVQFSWNALWPLILVAVGVVVLLQAIRPGPAKADGASAPFATPSAAPGAPSVPGTGGSSARIPREGTQQLEVELGVGAGTFRVEGGATELVEVRSIRNDIVSQVDRDGQRTRVRLRQDANWLPWMFRGGTDWDVRLPEDIPIALSANAGAGNLQFDLSRLRVVEARASIGAAQARVVLPRPTGEVEVKIQAGASSVTIEIPPGVEARVRGTGGLLSVEGRAETPGYATSRDRVSVTVSGGASSVRVI